MSFFIYGNSGGIDEIKRQLNAPNKRTVSTLKEVFENISKQHEGAVSVNDLSIIYYGYDPRIDMDVYTVTTNRYGSEDYMKKYKHPQYIGFFVMLENK